MALLMAMLISYSSSGDQFSDSSSLTISQTWLKRSHFLSQIPRDTQNEACTQRWESLVRDGSLDMVVALGYYDANIGGGEIHAADKSFSRSVINHLTAPCKTSGYNACGFSISESDQFFGFVTLAKSITDRRGRATQANIKVVHSALTWSDAENRGNEKSNQDRKTNAAKQVFFEGLKKSDVVFYHGHARDGGGPDFHYPVFSRGTHEVNYPWYQRHQPGLRELLDHLPRSPGQAQVLGLFACATNSHFRQRIKDTSGDLGYIGSNKVTSNHLLAISLMGAVDAFLGMKCQAGVSESLHVSSSYPITLTNFF
jgi:hypothetical protein